jgi:hypothetical protein
VRKRILVVARQSAGADKLTGETAIGFNLKMIPGLLLISDDLERVCSNNELRQIVVAVNPPTLAEKLGLPPHDSPLLKKAAGLGLGPAELQTLAVQRGCRHYSTGDEPVEPLASEDQCSNEELAVALLCIALPYDFRGFRCGAAVLGIEGVSPERIGQLAIQEQSAVPIRYVAEIGMRFEPWNLFWKELLDVLPPCAAPPQGVLPHPTRFVAMTGFTRKGPGFIAEWHRPGPRKLVIG